MDRIEGPLAEAIQSQFIPMDIAALPDCPLDEQSDEQQRSNPLNA